MKGRKFAILLKKILNEVGIKNASLADALGYDISYISKWTGGKNLPSAKNYDEIIRCIVLYAVSCVKGQEILFDLKEYSASSYNELEQTWETMLTDAYLQDAQYRNSVVNTSAKVDKFVALYSTCELIDEINEIFNRKEELVILLDIFSLDRESLLRFAGILGGTLIPNLSLGDANSKVKLIINLDEKQNGKSLYALIYLLHLICSFSYKAKFELYIDSISSGKIFILDWKQGTISSAGLLNGSTKCVSYLVKEDKIEAKSIHDTIKQAMTQENMALSNISIKQMLYEYDYFKIFMSTNVQWLLGHITELCLTHEQLLGLKDRIDIKDAKDFERILSVHESMMKTLENSKTQILIYETAIIDFMLSGEIDVYNYCIRLNHEERKLCINNIMALFSHPNINVKIILGGFCNDFMHVPNPCFFFSSLGACLRIENGLGRNNVYTVCHNGLKKYIEVCFSDMWSNRKDVVIEDKRAIYEMLNMHIASCAVMKP